MSRSGSDQPITTPRISQTAKRAGAVRQPAGHAIIGGLRASGSLPAPVVRCPRQWSGARASGPVPAPVVRCSRQWSGARASERAASGAAKAPPPVAPPRPRRQWRRQGPAASGAAKAAGVSAVKALARASAPPAPLVPPALLIPPVTPAPPRAAQILAGAGPETTWVEHRCRQGSNDVPSMLFDPRPQDNPCDSSGG
jgi:hypothetical protein